MGRPGGRHCARGVNSQPPHFFALTFGNKPRGNLVGGEIQGVYARLADRLLHFRFVFLFQRGDIDAGSAGEFFDTR